MSESRRNSREVLQKSKFTSPEVVENDVSNDTQTAKEVREYYCSKDKIQD